LDRIGQIGAEIEVSDRQKSGNKLPREIMLIPVDSAEGMLVAATIREIAEQKRFEKAVEEVLATSCGQLNELADQKLALDQHAIVAVTDVQGTITYVNDKFCAISQYSRDELIGQNHRILKSGHHSKDFFGQMYDAIANGTVWHGEIKNRAKDGSIYWVETTIVPLVGPDGRPQQYVSIRTDISKSKLAAEALVGKALELSRQAEELSRSRQALETQTRMLQSEARYRGLLEAAPDAMVVVNPTGEIVLLNVQAENQFGYSRDELIGQKVRNIIPQGFAERLIADGTRSATEALAQQIGAGIELVGRRKDGSEFPIEIMLSPLESADGILVTAAIRDISVRKAAESHLARMEGRYRGLLEAAPDAMVVVNVAGEIVLLNVRAEKEFGYSRDELVGQKVKNIIPEGFAERIIADGTRSAAEALAQQIGTGIALVGRRKDGGEFPIEIMLSPLESAEGILVTAAIRDITERKESDEHLAKTVEELKRSNDDLQQFAYVSSHDLQEPLRIVSSYTQLLAKRYKGRLDSDADEFIAFAVDGCNRMQGLIQDLLAYSRAGTNEKKLREVPSENALQKALINLRVAIKQSGAVVTNDALPAITTDETQVTQIFQNLVGNAIKYRRAEDPRVHVSAARNEGNEWTFSVRDNGLGIDPQYFERIFVLFQRLHGRDEFEGTGIGLAVCKRIVERLGGKIWVESQLEKGSTFCFTLPDTEEK
jgi:PAS domain S-box-containing protein